MQLIDGRLQWVGGALGRGQDNAKQQQSQDGPGIDKLAGHGNSCLTTASVAEREEQEEEEDEEDEEGEVDVKGSTH